MTHPAIPAPSRRPQADALAVLAVAAAMLLPALWNGFPFVFSDTGEYLARAEVLDVPAYRTVGYSAWIALMGHRTTLWVTIAAQALLVAALIGITARTLVPRMPRVALVAGGLALAILTSVSTRVSQLMPDIFAPVLVLALYLVVWHWPRLGRASRAVAGLGVAASLVMHATHVGLALGLLLVYAGGAAMAGAAGRARWRGIARGALCVALGTGALLSFNFWHTRRVFLAQNGHVFVLSHLVQTGLAERLLREECPRGAHYDLCPYIGDLQVQGQPLTPDQFAWHPASPLYRIGGWAGSKDEASRILWGTLRRYPLSHALDAVFYTLDQLGAVSTLEGLESYADIPWVDVYIQHLRPGDYSRMHAARQQRGTLGFEGLARVHEALALAAAAASLWLLFWPRLPRASREPGSIAGFHRTVWLVLLGNAAMCGNLSGVYARYQARLVWLLPFAVLLSVAARWWPASVGADSAAGAGGVRAEQGWRDALVGAA